MVERSVEATRGTGSNPVLSTMNTTMKKSGRSDTGRLRNFSQMSDDKLKLALEQIRREDNDSEARVTVECEWELRNPTQGNVVNIADELKALDKQRLDLAKKALNDTLSEVFKNHSIESISWGQKYTAYNDEGMYEGVSGPVINVEIDPNGDRMEWQDAICYHPDPTPPDCIHQVKILKNVLDAIGSKTLCDIVGDDEYVVTATREKPVYSFKLTAEYAGY